MTANSEIMLTNQVHPGDSTSETVTGVSLKGDGYYGRSDGFHTVQYSLESFVGTINIQATLAIEPTESDWFTLSETTHTSDSASGSNSSNGFIYNFTGNYVWVRAKVSDWTDGNIGQILLNH